METDQSELTIKNEVNRDLTTVVKGAQGPIDTVVFSDVAPLPMEKNPIDSDEDDNYSKFKLQMPPKSDNKITPVFDELKLYKAEQKRMKSYLKQGIDVEVARLLCKKYVHDLRKELLKSNEKTKDTISNVLISANEVEPVFDKIKPSGAAQERHRYFLEQDMAVIEAPKQGGNSMPEFPYLRKEICEHNIYDELQHSKGEQDKDSEVVGQEKICEVNHISGLNKDKRTFCNMQPGKKLPQKDIALNSPNVLITESEAPDMRHSEAEKSSNSQNDREAKPVTDRVKLSGAARKRLRLYLDEGIALEEARELCQKPMREVRKEIKVKKLGSVKSKTTGNQVSTKGSDDKADSVCKKKNPTENIKRKTTRSNRSNIPDIKKPTTEKAATKGENVVKNISDQMPSTMQHNFTSDKEIKEINIKIGVIPPDYPKTLWPDTKLKAIKEAILDKIVEQRKGSVKPKFSNCSFKPGYITFTCRDNETSDWMLKTVPTLKPWQKAALKVVTQIEIPKTSIIIGYFPDDANTSNEIIFGRIESQNGDLSIECWKVLKRVNKENSIELTISVDPISAEVFKRNDYSIYYKYGKVNLRPIKGRQQPNAAENSM